MPDFALIRPRCQQETQENELDKGERQSLVLQSLNWGGIQQLGKDNVGGDQGQAKGPRRPRKEKEEEAAEQSSSSSLLTLWLPPGLQLTFCFTGVEK